LDEIGGLRKLPNKELHNLYSSPNTLGTIKSRRMRWAGHVARTKAARNRYMVLIKLREEAGMRTQTKNGG
jgi:hypothetical protein